MSCMNRNANNGQWCRKEQHHPGWCVDGFGNRFAATAPFRDPFAAETFSLSTGELDRLRELAAELEIERTQRIEQRAAELYAQQSTMPAEVGNVTGPQWAAFAAVVACKLADPREELEAVELYAEMQQP